MLRALQAAMRGGCERFGFRLTEWSLQANHIHMICEADDEVAMGRGLKGVGVRLSKKVNGVQGRRGSVLTDRYHAHVLRTPIEVRNALLYVLSNVRKHDAALGRYGRRPGRYAPMPAEGVFPVDPASSAPWFLGWRVIEARGSPIVWIPEEVLASPAPVAEPRSWLLREGWKKHGLLHVLEIPGAGARP